MLIFFNDTATTEIYTLALHDALPILLPFAAISPAGLRGAAVPRARQPALPRRSAATRRNVARPGRGSTARLPVRADRKSTRLNSSHANISYAVFFLKKILLPS